MPEISRFLGVVIRMFYQEHGLPHFHAEHRGEQATFSFDGDPIAGGIRSRVARRHIRRWAALHRQELEANWQKLRAGRPLERIEPLK